MNGAGANIDAISTEYTGLGVVVGIVDEGFDTTNPDLTGRFDLGDSYDPRDHGATNIMPDSSAAVHGTWVAGVLGASADNDYGIVGVAPDATLAGFYARFGAGGSSRAELTDLLARQVNVDVSNNSWGYTTEFGDNFQNASWSSVSNALHADAAQGRGGLGTVLVFAAGNDRQYIANSAYDGDNTNYHSLTNSRFVITAAASTEHGHIAPYSTPGASILVTAPGDSIITTADNNNDGNPNNDIAYVSGTSFAAPIVSGVVAMMLEANPDLGYRDVQEILALSSEKIDPASSSWSENGATNWNGGANLVSNDFGFGLIDAHAAVRLAETWTMTHTAANEQVISLAGNVGGNGALADFHPNDYTVTVPAANQNFSIDWVEVDVSLQHSHIGDLKIDLISPTGTDSVLMDMPADDTNSQANLSFTFSTDHDWGESPVGTWTLVVEDAGTGGTGSLLSFAIRIYGDDQGPNTTYYYTDDFATLSGNRGPIDDAGHGQDTINAAAVTSDLNLDLHSGAVSTIAGHAVTISAETTIVTAYGGDGNDTIIGNDAGDHLYGGHGNDTILGGHGDDTIDGGVGADTMAGGTGNDTYYVDNAGDHVIEHANEGIDTVISSVGHTLEANVENLALTGSSNIDGTGNELDNVITSNSGVDTLTGGGGNDTYFVHNALDHVVEMANGGNDTVYADVDYTLPANVETLVLVGSGGAHAMTDALDATHGLSFATASGLDNIDGIGNDLDNTLIGTAGDNVLDGGHGADAMIGGAGNDTYMVDNPGDTIVEYANEGNDTVITHVDYTLGANVENLTLSGPDSLSGTGNDLGNVILGNDAGDTIDGAGGDDGIAGGAGNDHISGGGGADWIYGFGGDDVLQGGVGNDVLFGGDGNDTLNGGDGDNFLSGDAGNDNIVGGNGDNFMFGGDGDDHIVGGDGNDAVAAGAGDDTVDGGAGINWIDGGDGNDVLSGGNGSNALFGDAGDDQLTGGDGVDGLDGGDGNDTLVGGAGDDWLYGDAGKDILIGGAGNDVLVGGDGDDRLVGGAGTDFLAGGAGADTFVFNAPAEGGDVVCDFTHGVDVIEINAAGFGLPASGALPDAMFAQGDGLPASFASDAPTFYVDHNLDALWFDPTGGSSSDAVIVAGFLGDLPTASDFHLV